MRADIAEGRGISLNFSKLIFAGDTLIKGTAWHLEVVAMN